MTIWEEPPPRSVAPRKPSKWQERLAPLLENPGRWARFDFDSPVSAETAAPHLRRGRYRVPEGMNASDLETRYDKKREPSALYVRWVPK